MPRTTGSGGDAATAPTSTPERGGGIASRIGARKRTKRGRWTPSRSVPSEYRSGTTPATNEVKGKRHNRKVFERMGAMQRMIFGGDNEGGGEGNCTHGDGSDDLSNRSLNSGAPVIEGASDTATSKSSSPEGATQSQTESPSGESSQRDDSTSANSSPGEIIDAAVNLSRETEQQVDRSMMSYSLVEDDDDHDVGHMMNQYCNADVSFQSHVFDPHNEDARVGGSITASGSVVGDGGASYSAVDDGGDNIDGDVPPSVDGSDEVGIGLAHAVRAKVMDARQSADPADGNASDVICNDSQVTDDQSRCSPMDVDRLVNQGPGDDRSTAAAVDDTEQPQLAPMDIDSPGGDNRGGGEDQDSADWPEDEIDTNRNDGDNALNTNETGAKTMKTTRKVGDPVFVRVSLEKRDDAAARRHKSGNIFDWFIGEIETIVQPTGSGQFYRVTIRIIDERYAALGRPDLPECVTVTGDQSKSIVGMDDAYKGLSILEITEDRVMGYHRQQDKSTDDLGTLQSSCSLFLDGKDDKNHPGVRDYLLELYQTKHVREAIERASGGSPVTIIKVMAWWIGQLAGIELQFEKQNTGK